MTPTLQEAANEIKALRQDIADMECYVEFIRCRCGHLVMKGGYKCNHCDRDGE